MNIVFKKMVLHIIFSGVVIVLILFLFLCNYGNKQSFTSLVGSWLSEPETVLENDKNGQPREKNSVNHLIIKKINQQQLQLTLWKKKDQKETTLIHFASSTGDQMNFVSTDKKISYRFVADTKKNSLIFISSSALTEKESTIEGIAKPIIFKKNSEK